MVICLNLLTHQKSVLLTESNFQIFLERKGNQNTKRKSESYVFSALVMAFLAAENENLQMKDFTRADFSYIFIGSEKVNN